MKIFCYSKPLNAVKTVITSITSATNVASKSSLVFVSRISTFVPKYFHNLNNNWLPKRNNLSLWVEINLDTYLLQIINKTLIKTRVMILVKYNKNKPTDISNKLTGNLEDLDPAKVGRLCNYLWQHKDAKSSSPTEAIKKLKASLPKATGEPMFAFLKQFNKSTESTKIHLGQEGQELTAIIAPAPAPGSTAV